MERAAPENGDGCSNDEVEYDVKSDADWNDERWPVDGDPRRLKSRELKNCGILCPVDAD